MQKQTCFCGTNERKKKACYLSLVLIFDYHTTGSAVDLEGESEVLLHLRKGHIRFVYARYDSMIDAII